MKCFSLVVLMALCACRIDALGPHGHGHSCFMWEPIVNGKTGEVIGYLGQRLDCTRYNTDSLVAAGWLNHHP